MVDMPSLNRGGGGGGSGGGGARRPQSWLRLVALVLRILLWPLRSLLDLLFPPSDLDGLSPVVTAKAAQAFSSCVARVANSTRSLSASNPHVPWATTGFGVCKAEALRNRSLLCIYLHSPLHRDADRAIQKLLCDQAVVTQLNQPQIINLGVSIHSGQGAHLAQMLNAAAYPLLAVLQPPLNDRSSSSSSSSSSSPSSMHLIMRAEGSTLVNMSPSSLARHLSAAVQRHQLWLTEQEARRLQREQETQLRREQDAEYQAALLADQERQRQQEEERNSREQLEQEKARAEQRKEQAKQDRLGRAKSLLADQTVPGNPTRIRFVLPSGRKLQQTFVSGNTVEVLRAFLIVHFHENSMEMPNIGLSTSFPKRTYNNDDENNLTLEEAGLSPQAVLMVQDLDA